MSNERKKHLTLTERSAYHGLEDIVGCKWSAGVVVSIARGVRRPGELERYIPGISKKILTERLRKLTEYDVIAREEFPGRVRRVEYRLTPTGEKLACFSHHLRKVVREAPAGQRLGKALAPAAADGTSLQGGPEVKRKALLLRPFGRISHRGGEKCGLAALIEQLQELGKEHVGGSRANP